MYRLPTIIMAAFAIGNAHGRDDLLDKAKARHGAAIGAIAFFECESERIDTFSGDPPRVRELKGQYHAAGGTIRAVEKDQGSRLTIDSLCKDGIVWSVVRRNTASATSVGASRSASSRTELITDPFVNMLMVFPTTGKRAPLDQFLRQPHQQFTCERVREGLHSVVKIALVTGEGENSWYFEVILDPGYNYLARRVVARPNGRAGLSSEWEITQFDEPASGVFFPVESRLVASVAGKEQSRAICKITKLKVGQSLPDGIFRLDLPPGVEVSDRTNNTKYRADRNGNPIGPVEQLRGGPSGRVRPDVPPNASRATRLDDGWPSPLQIGALGLCASLMLWGGSKWIRK